jgi:hypothetical protein
MAAGKKVSKIGFVSSDDNKTFNMSPIKKRKTRRRVVTILPTPVFPSFIKEYIAIRKMKIT